MGQYRLHYFPGSGNSYKPALMLTSCGKPNQAIAAARELPPIGRRDDADSPPEMMPHRLQRSETAGIGDILEARAHFGSRCSCASLTRSLTSQSPGDDPVAS